MKKIMNNSFIEIYLLFKWYNIYKLNNKYMSDKLKKLIG